MKCTKYFRLFALTAFFAVGLLGCNIFNPLENERINNDDADALIYEGYQNIRNAEYTKAASHFSKAIATDSSKSDAWYGLAKSVLNQYNLNVFEMLKYANTNDKKNGFLNMPDTSANKYREGIDTVLKILDLFIARDSTNKTDKRIRFANFTTSYTILQMANVAILIRNTESNVTSLFESNNSGEVNLNWDKLKNLADTAAVTTINALAASAQAIKADPDNSYPIIRKFIPSAESLSDEELKENTLTIADQFIEMSQNINQNIDRSSVFINVGNGLDDDGDGCVDEEVWDGKDNDGDEEIDEDLRVINSIVFKSIWTERTVEKLIIPEGSFYESLDIDGNGYVKEDSEWNFIYTKEQDRKTKNDHRLLFSEKLSFIIPSDGNIIKNKELVRLDTNVNVIKYDLDWRKENIGGCWVNYSEANFLQWFEGRN